MLGQAANLLSRLPLLREVLFSVRYEPQAEETVEHGAHNELLHSQLAATRLINLTRGLHYKLDLVFVVQGKYIGI